MKFFSKLSPTMKVDITPGRVIFIRLGDKQRQFMVTWKEMVHFLLLPGVMDHAVEMADDLDDRVKKFWLRGYEE